MPWYNDRDSNNPDDISWFEDSPYNDGDSKNPDNFSWFEDTPASAVNKEGYYDHLCFPDHPTFPIMEPDNNAPPPPANNYRGIMGGPPPERTSHLPTWLHMPAPLFLTAAVHEAL